MSSAALNQRFRCPPQNLPFSFFSLHERCPGFLILTLWLGSCGIVFVTAVAVSPEAIRISCAPWQRPRSAILLNPGVWTKQGRTVTFCVVSPVIAIWMEAPVSLRVKCLPWSRAHRQTYHLRSFDAAKRYGYLRR